MIPRSSLQKHIIREPGLTGKKNFETPLGNKRKKATPEQVEKYPWVEKPLKPHRAQKKDGALEQFRRYHTAWLSKAHMKTYASQLD